MPRKSNITEEDRAKIDTFNVTMRMYGVHYKASISEGARRPFRVEWLGVPNTNGSGYTKPSFTYSWATNPETPHVQKHFFENRDLLEKFIFTRLVKNA